MSESIYLIYKHTSPSGKSYIGLTSRLDKRNKEHQSPNSGCTYFSNAIQKYGWNNFVHEILAENLTVDEANTLEQTFIIEHNTIVPNGYNLRLGGGRTSKHSEVSIQKMKEARIGKPGIPRSPEAREKMSRSRMGIARPKTLEHKAKIRAAHLGKKKPGSGPRDKTWRIKIVATDEIIVVPHLKQYCKEQQLRYKSIIDRFRLGKSYKGLVFIDSQ